MNDVLPKPFTKEGLLNMLEKHLAHLKKMPEGLDMVPPTASTLAGPIGSGGASSSVAHSLKEESPPEASPSTVSTAAWHSPSAFGPGMSPAGPGPYLGGPAAAGSYAVDHSGGLQYPSPTTPVGGRLPPQKLPGPGPPPQGAGPHRRQVSEMASADNLLGGEAKRARLYAQPGAAVGQMGQRGPSG